LFSLLVRGFILHGQPGGAVGVNLFSNVRLVSFGLRLESPLFRRTIPRLFYEGSEAIAGIEITTSHI